MRNIAFIYCIIFIILATMRFSLCMEQDNKKLVLYKEVLQQGVSSVLSNMAESVDQEFDPFEQPQGDSSKIIVECPLLDNFSNDEIALGEYFLNRMVSSSVCVKDDVNNFINSLSLEKKVSLLNFCDAFGIQKGLKSIQNILVSEISKGIDTTNCESAQDTFSFLKKARYMYRELPYPLQADLIDSISPCPNSMEPVLLTYHRTYSNSTDTQYVDPNTNKKLFFYHYDINLSNNLSNNTKYTDEITPQKLATLDLLTNKVSTISLPRTNKDIHYWIHAWDGNDRVLVSLLDHRGPLSYGFKGRSSTTFYIINIKENTILNEFESDYIRPQYDCDILKHSFFGSSYVMWQNYNKLHYYDMSAKKEKVLIEEVADTLFSRRNNILLTTQQEYRLGPTHTCIWQLNYPNHSCALDNPLLKGQFPIDLYANKVAINDEGTLISYIAFYQLPKEYNSIFRLHEIKTGQDYVIYTKDGEIMAGTSNSSSAFSKDGGFLFILQGKVLRIVDVETKKELNTITLQEEYSNMQTSDYNIIFENQRAIKVLSLAKIYCFAKMNYFNLFEIIAIKLFDQCTSKQNNTLKVDKSCISILKDMSETIQKLLFGHVIVQNSNSEQEEIGEFIEKISALVADGTDKHTVESKMLDDRNTNDQNRQYKDHDNFQEQNNDCLEYKESDDSTTNIQHTQLDNGAAQNRSNCKNTSGSEYTFQDAQQADNQYFKKSILYWLWASIYRRLPSVFR